MFGLFRSKRPERTTAARRSVPLFIEQLETRDCPAAPTLTSFTAAPLNNGQQVELRGSVSDENLATVVVGFTGVAVGSIIPDASGAFSFITTATGLGTVSAEAVDQENLSSGTVNASLTSNAPTISLSVSYGAGTSVTLSGTVTDENPASCVVNFTGVVTGSVAPNANGTFSYTTQASGLGAVQAVATDIWAQASNTASVTVTSNAPSIVDFAAIELGENVWKFQGRVIDESTAYLVVRLGGLASLENETIAVDQYGWFFVTYVLQPGESGTATAQTTDWWGLDSNVAFVQVNPTP